MPVDNILYPVTTPAVQGGEVKLFYLLLYSIAFRTLSPID